MQELINLLNNSQTDLLKRVLEYAKLHGYTKYTSTLEEAWVASISGLSKALTDAIKHNKKVPEIEVDTDFGQNPIAAFGLLEARKHRERGISLEMFLALMKYYRQAYLDLVEDKISVPEKQSLFLLWINRFFDQNEISFCFEWTSQTNISLLAHLQLANRDLTNEKNKYLTIYESMPTPAIILDADHRIININYAAQQLLQEKTLSPGHAYYSALPVKPQLSDALPWIYNEFMSFYYETGAEKSIEKYFESPSLGRRNLLVKFHKMLDVSNKFEGTVILINDLTEHKNIENQLRELSFRDQLTGLYNRAYMKEETIRLSSGRFNPVAFISIDVDGLKLINDNLGHSAGDAVLITVSSIIKKTFRKNDVIVRLGGDEFIILLPSSDEDTVDRICRQLRHEVDEHNRTHQDIPISISIGWSLGNLGDNQNYHELIKEADSRMYDDKKINHAQFEMIFWSFIKKRI